MKIIKEQLLGMRGGWIVKARLVEYSTAEKGTFSRPELTLEDTSGDPVGFSLRDLEEFHTQLRKFAEQNLCF